MKVHYQAVIASPLGRIGVVVDADGALCCLDVVGDTHPLQQPKADSVRRVALALAAYFDNPGLRFDLPLAPAGTAYQRRVWAELTRIPAGETCSYGDLAGLIDSAPRAVGQACRRNPIPIVVPCHRVIGRQGVGGYSGAVSGPQLDIKRWLLRHEGVTLPD